jgi:hypothetical protein
LRLGSWLGFGIWDLGFRAGAYTIPGAPARYTIPGAPARYTIPGAPAR